MAYELRSPFRACARLMHTSACMRKKGNLRNNNSVKDCGVECKTLVSQVKYFLPRQESLRRDPARQQTHRQRKHDGRSLSNTASKKYIKISGFLGLVQIRYKQNSNKKNNSRDRQKILGQVGHETQWDPQNVSRRSQNSCPMPRAKNKNFISIC